MTSIIFLDIDGVLNHFRMTEDDTIRLETGKLSRGCINELNILTNETGAKIVISSTWRKDSRKDVKSLTERLSDAGITGEIIGQTPIFNQRSIFRGNEIYEWVQSNPEHCGNSPSNYKDYVILDDDSDMLYWQRNNLVLTDHYSGLTPAAGYRARRILEGLS